MNKPEISNCSADDIKAAYRKETDLKTLSRQFLLPVSEIRKIVKETK